MLIVGVISVSVFLWPDFWRDFVIKAILEPHTYTSGNLVFWRLRDVELPENHHFLQHSEQSLMALDRRACVHFFEGELKKSHSVVESLHLVLDCPLLFVGAQHVEQELFGLPFLLVRHHGCGEGELRTDDIPLSVRELLPIPAFESSLEMNVQLDGNHDL